MARWGKRVFESRLPQIITRRKASSGCQAQGGEMGCQAMSKGNQKSHFWFVFLQWSDKWAVALYFILDSLPNDIDYQHYRTMGYQLGIAFLFIKLDSPGGGGGVDPCISIDVVEVKRESMPLTVDYLEGTDRMNFQIQFEGGCSKY